MNQENGDGKSSACQVVVEPSELDIKSALRELSRQMATMVEKFDSLSSAVGKIDDKLRRERKARKSATSKIVDRLDALEDLKKKLDVVESLPVIVKQPVASYVNARHSVSGATRRVARYSR